MACVGLLQAIDRFDLSRGTAFASYAVPTIAGELRRHFRDRGWTVRVPRDLQELSLKLRWAEDALAAALGRPPDGGGVAERLDIGVERLLEARELQHREASRLTRPAGFHLEHDQEGASLVEHIGSLDQGYRRTDDASAAQDLLHGLPELERAVLVLRFRDELTQAQSASVSASADAGVPISPVPARTATTADRHNL